MIFEVEETDIPTGWELKSDDNGHLGAGYIEWRGPNHFARKEAGNGAITVGFRIATEGNYELRWRSRINEGELATEHNDSWVRLATGTNIPDEYPLSGWTKAFMNAQDTWSWQTHTKDHDGQSIRQHLEAGDHTIEISGRSRGHAIDRVALYRYDTVDFDSGDFDALPVSTTATAVDSGGGGDLDCDNDTETDTATDTGPDASCESNGPGDSDGSETEVDEEAGGDTDGESEESVASINAERLDGGVEDEWVAGECTDGRLHLTPVDDATLERTAYVDGDVLSLQADGPHALLKYDLRAVSGIIAASLQYDIIEATGAGTVTFSLGSHTNWPASTAVNAPDAMITLGKARATWRGESRYASSIDARLLASDRLTVIARHGIDGDALSIASTEHPELAGPTLVLSGGFGFCDDYRRALTELDSDQDSQPIEEVDTEESGIDSEVQVDDSETDADNENDGETEAEYDTAKADSGAAGWFFLLILVMCLQTRRKHRIHSIG